MLALGAGATCVAVVLAALDVVAVRFGPCETAEGRTSGSCQAIVHHNGIVRVLVIVAALNVVAAGWSWVRGSWRPSAVALLLVVGASVATVLGAAT